MDIHNMMNLLHKAQQTYGYPNQISVATEELAELIQVLSKYPRYPDHSTAMEDNKFRDKLIDEVADVCVVLQHIHMIFNLTPEEIDDRMDLKLKRLERWLNESPDLYQSVLDREVK